MHRQRPVAGNDFARLLQRNDFDAVLERYELLQLQAGDAAVAAARAEILAYARRLISAGRYSLAEQLLQKFLVTAYRDVEARVLLAEAYQGQGDFLAAIDQLLRGQGLCLSPGHAAAHQRTYSIHGGRTGAVTETQA